MFKQLKMGLKEFFGYSLLEMLAMLILIFANYLVLNFFDVDIFELIDSNVYLFGLIIVVNLGLIIWIYSLFFKK